MGATNKVQVQAVCPECGVESDILCEVHAASSITLGDFFDKIYKLGEKMAWLPEWSLGFYKWRCNGKKININNDRSYDEECCCSVCMNCHKAVYVIIAYKDVTPVEVISLGKEKEAPIDDYYF